MRRGNDIGAEPSEGGGVEKEFRCGGLAALQMEQVLKSHY